MQALRSRHPGPAPARWAAAGLVLWAAMGAAQAEPLLANPFNDPFQQATSGYPGCPQPDVPRYTAQAVRDAAHVRSQAGGSCHRVGRCRLPNSYLYDAEIVPRAALHLREEGRFGDAAIWLLGERRIVTLKGCVRSAEQARDAEQAVQRVDDVLNVVNELQVGTGGRPPYAVAPP